MLATTEDGVRIYSGDETVRRALLHTVGDPYGYISTSVQYTMRAKLSGYNIVTGLNDTIFNRMGSDIALTIDQDACVAAYNALGGKNGGVIVYNYETGEVLVKVSTPTFDPNAVPEDIETNDAYKGPTWTTPCPVALPPVLSLRSSPQRQPWRSTLTPGAPSPMTARVL